jgi:hypothetical protein
MGISMAQAEEIQAKDPSATSSDTANPQYSPKDSSSLTK